MRAVDVRIQGSWLHRRGLRGRWVTVYLHRYSGQESTERPHSHPWVVAFGVVLRGRLLEVVGREGGSPRRRGLLSLGIYRRGVSHRIEGGDALTVFVGFLRTQVPIERAAEVRMAEGYCHYTEIMPDEPGFRRDLVAAGSTERGSPPSPRLTSDRHGAH